MIYQSFKMAVKAIAGHKMRSFLTILGAVSYTHLDVYKRQVLVVQVLMNLKAIPALWVLKRGRWVRNITAEGSQA